MNSTANIIFEEDDIDSLLSSLPYDQWVSLPDTRPRPFIEHVLSITDYFHLSSDESVEESHRRVCVFFSRFVNDDREKEKRCERCVKHTHRPP
jgi:hypothetical protein